MGLNIKNARVCALAKEAAAITGTTQTGAIETALERLIAEAESVRDQERGARRRRLEVALDALAQGWADGTGPERTPEDLYDPATGLPR